MDIEKQVCSLELAKRLKELGVKQESLFHWVAEANEAYPINPWLHYGKMQHMQEWQYSALTVAELGEILPNRVFLKGKEPFDSYTISIKKFYTVAEDRIATNNYIINYDCDSTSIAGEDAWLSRKLCKNIYNPNLADAMADMLIYLIENNLYEPK